MKLREIFFVWMKLHVPKGTVQYCTKIMLTVNTHAGYTLHRDYHTAFLFFQKRVVYAGSLNYANSVGTHK